MRNILNGIFDFASYHLYIAGKGDCCKDDPLVIKEDEQLIRQAIRSGEITVDQLTTALINVFDGNKGYCPWVNRGSNTCNIHAVRPLICAVAGGAALPEDDLEMEEVLSGRRPFVQVTDDGSTKSSMCHTCLADKNVKVPGHMLKHCLCLWHTLQLLINLFL